MLDKLVISQSNSLSGEIDISGSKNAALPIICATLLTSHDVLLTNVPCLRDVLTMEKLLNEMGVKTSFNKNTFTANAANIHSTFARYELVKTMRASILSLGALLSRFGEATVSFPGGCAIGARPIDQHLKGLTAMGAEIHINNGNLIAKAKKLFGAHIVMDQVTVTGTENLMMAAVLADGCTVIENAAREPEVLDLAIFLSKIGAKITGAGTDKITIQGVKQLNGCEHAISPDRIEAGTFAVAAVITRGKLKLNNTNYKDMSSVIDKLRLSGATITSESGFIDINMTKKPSSVDIHTATYPGFPTDMQAQFMVLNSIADNTATIVETIFENRYMHALELLRMGANIHVDGNTATVHGVNKLQGATVMATDLRASASLLLAGLIAENTTTIERIYHLDRGYDGIAEKLNSVGANIIRSIPPLNQS